MSDSERVAENLWVYRHGLINHKLGLMRDKDCPPNRFRALTKEISTFLAYQASADLKINTSGSGQADGLGDPYSADVLLAVVPILRAGLVVADGALEAMPAALVGHIGFQREDDYSVSIYLGILPSPDDRMFFVCDAILGTGNTACAAVRFLREYAKVREDHIRFLTLLVSNEGAQQMAREHPGVQIHAASLEKRLNKKNHIEPGFGDASDRLFGIW